MLITWRHPKTPLNRERTLKSLTPSLPQPVKFPGWKMQGPACKQYIFRSCNIYFECCAFWWKSFHMPVPKKKKKKGLRDFSFALLMVIFNGSEGVMHTPFQKPSLLSAFGGGGGGGLKIFRFSFFSLSSSSCLYCMLQVPPFFANSSRCHTLLYRYFC